VFCFEKQKPVKMLLRMVDAQYRNVQVALLDISSPEVTSSETSSPFPRRTLLQHTYPVVL